ncbi:hypothetical protein U1872_12530 [Sphingomonas sp. RB3P16]|uniref:hypothetical protein n=1 Tax=Parasphingomonas frigoris TaxID=3096163 RepID=UPI002FCAA6CE
MILSRDRSAPALQTEEVILLHASGFVDRGLAALYMFGESGGTSFADALGGPPGNLDFLVDSNNAFSRLPKGGVSLSGAQFISFPAYEANAPWTLLTAGAIVGDAGAEFEKITGYIGHRTAYGANARGTYLYARGATSWGAPANVTDYFQHRTNGGGEAVDVALSPIDQNAASVHHLIAHSYDGAGALISTLYDAAGTVVATVETPVTPAQLFGISGAIMSMLQPVIGGLSEVFDGARQHFEFVARYTRALTDFSAAELQIQVATAVRLGAARMRPWA